MHTLVTIVAFAIVIGGSLLWLNSVLGQWSILMWVGLGIAVLMGVAQKINA